MNDEIFDNGAWENDYDDTHGDDFDTCDESMDGDFDSGMRDAGMGTDESYGYFEDEGID